MRRTGPGPGPGPAGSPGVWAAPPSDGVAARAGCTAPCVMPGLSSSRVWSRVTVAHLLGPLEHFIAPPHGAPIETTRGEGCDSMLSPRTWGASCRPSLHGPWPQVSKGLLKPCCPPWAVLMLHSIPELGHFVFPLHTLLYFQAFSVLLLCPWSSEPCLVHTWQAL